MADINSSLPIRTETDGDVVSKIVDSAGTNVLAVDASGRITSIMHDGTNALDLVVIDSAFGAATVSIPVAGKYEATPTTYTDGDATALLTDANGRLQVDVISGGGGPEDTDDDSIAAGQTTGLGVNLNYGYDGAAWERITTDGAGSMDVNVTLALPTGANTIGAVNLNDGAGTALTSTLVSADQALDVNLVQSVTLTETNSSAILTAVQLIDDLVLTEDAVHSTGASGVMTLAVRNDTASALAGTDGDYIPLTTDSLGNLRVFVGNSETNSIPVHITSGISGTEIHDYSTATVSASATNNHDVTVTAANTFMLRQIVMSASGKAKWEVQVGPVLSLATKAVVFTTSDTPTHVLTFDKPIEVDDASSGTIRVIRKNLENEAMDVYTTIIGDEIPD